MKQSIKNRMLLTVFAIGCMAAYAQLPYNTSLTQSQYENGSTVIKKEGQQKWENNGVRLGTTGIVVGNWDDKYIIIALDQTSIPDRLTFRYKCNSVIATNPNWYVAESPDNSSWSKIWSAVTPTSSSVSVSTDWITASPITLSKSTKYIKLCYSGNYAGTYADIMVSDQSYVNDPKMHDEVVSTVDFGAGSISSGVSEQSFDVEWCNVNTLTVTCSNTEFFSVSPASFGGKARYGTQAVVVTYDRDKAVGSHSASVTISNGSVTKSVTLSGQTTKRDQTIHWNAGLEATSFTLNASDALTGGEIATTDNEEAEMTYTTSDETVVAVSEDGKTIYAVENGTAEITAHAPGNDIYNEASATRLFTVTSKKKQVVEWNQNLMGLRTTEKGVAIALTATATSGGVITYAIEEGSSPCVTLSGENNATMTVTGTPGEAYIIATQAGGLIDGEEWITATFRKHITVRDPNSSCDEYALADQSFTFPQGHKTSFAVKEFNLAGKPTRLSFSAVAGGTQYLWSEREAIYVEQYANFGSGPEWRQVASMTLSESSKQYGPYTLDETATKIRFRSGDYSEQKVSNISVPRKKELAVSESSIAENAERNVRWSKTISVSRSNIDVMDITVVSSDPDCPFELSRTSIGTDCADRSTETFTVSITPREKNKVYTGTITLTDGKYTPTTHTIDLSVTAVAFNQSINGFELPETALTTDEVPAFAATATSGLEVVYLSSDSTIAYVADNRLVILGAGTVDITAYQEGDNRYNAASVTKTITISLAPVTILAAPEASVLVSGMLLGESVLSGGAATVSGSFSWQSPETVPEEGEHSYPVVFTPEEEALYASASTEVSVLVLPQKQAQTITWEDEPVQLTVGDTLQLAATASSGLDITFLSTDSTVAYVNAAHELLALSAGEVTISAVQNGDALFLPAEAVEKTYTVVLPPTTYGAYDAAVCAGDSVEFAGVWYSEAVEAEILLEEKNSQGGDSVIMLSITVHPVYQFSDTLVIHAGMPESWQDISLGEIAEGDTTLVAAYTTADGCDSVYTLRLSVLPMVTTYGEYHAALCAGDSVEFEGVWYSEPVETEVLVSPKNRYGGDSIVALSVSVNPVYLFEDTAEVHAGMSDVWEGISLGQLPEGDTTLIASYVSQEGCDSVYTLRLSVLPMITTYGDDTIYLCSGERIVYEGKTYRRSTKDSVLVSERNQYGGDSIVALVVTVLPTMRLTAYQTINEGDSVIWQDIDLSLIPAGDTTLVASYTSVNGCDSVYILKLTVIEVNTTGVETIGEDTLPAEKFFRNGQMYIRKNRQVYNLQGIKVEMME